MTEHTPPQLGWSAIYVTNVQTSVDLYTKAFGLTVAFIHPGGDYAEFATGTTALALVDVALAADSTGLPIDTSGSPRSNVTLVVDDVRAAFEHAESSGVTAIVEPATKPWGQVSSYVADLDGNLIELASRVEAADDSSDPDGNEAFPVAPIV